MPSGSTKNHDLLVFRHHPSDDVYLASDYHFCHANSIKYGGRPFASVDEMDNVFVDNWNKTVSPTSVVYFVGDFSLSFRAVESYTEFLNGKKYLIPGNHDFVHSKHPKSKTVSNYEKWKKEYEKHGWTVLPEQILLEVEGYRKFLVCHLPYYRVELPSIPDKYENWRPKWSGRFLIHGHMHEKGGKTSCSINVSVDVWKGYPASLKQVLEVVESEVDLPPTKWGQSLYDSLGYKLCTSV